MKVGAGKSEIYFPEKIFPTEGFSMLCSSFYARTAIICSEIDIAILSLELTSLPDEEIGELKRILSEVTGIIQERCFICVTHTFSAPHILPDKALNSDVARNKKAVLKSVIHTAARKSAEDAKATIATAQLKLGQSECHINVNRDFETKDGWWVSNCGTGPSDKTLTTICAETETGEPLLVLMHYAVQSSVLDGSILPDGGKAASSDLVGAACTELERKYKGATVMFLLGAAGDQAPVKKSKTVLINDVGELSEKDIGKDGIDLCCELGLQMAASAQLAIESAQPIDKTDITTKSIDFFVPAKQMNCNLSELKPTRFYEYVPDGEKQIRAEALKIGPVVLLCVKPELNCITAKEISKKSPFDTTLILTMVNGGAKYMADADSYDRFTYEAMNSPFAAGAAEKLCKETLNMLKQFDL